ncbi:MAG: glutaredoxin family protein [Planctomycetales bacterium]|nr:glutaredoxin family protein [Planctomycetales bacterium]
MSVILYTRQGCHLCDEALSLLMQYGLTPEIVDIDTDADLQKQFTTCVPVVQVDGKIRFRGKVNEVLLRRLLEKLG